MAAVGAAGEERRSQPTREIDAAMTNLCRCGTYPRVRRAIPPRATAEEAPWHETRTRLSDRRSRRGGRPRRRLSRWANSFDPRPRPGRRQRRRTARRLAEDRAPTTRSPSTSPHIDMGQGTHTALAMMPAEELDADWSQVSTKRAPGEKAFANRFLARGWILHDRDSRHARRSRRHGLHARRRGRSTCRSPAARPRCVSPAVSACARGAAAGHADRGRGAPLERPRSAITAARASSATPRFGRKCPLRRAGGRRGEVERAGEPALKQPQRLQYRRHVDAAARHSGQGRRRG